jgi:molybdenum cofactor guanylyltransferase
MVCCVIGGGLSAVPRQWVGAVLAGRSGGSDPRNVRQAVELLRPQVPSVIVSTDAEPGRLNGCGVPVVVGEYAGPAGMVLAALGWTAENAWETPWVATVAAGGEPMPPDLVARLATAVSGSGADMACVAGGGHIAWPLGLWPVRLRGDLRQAIKMAGAEGSALADWARRFAVAVIDLPPSRHEAFPLEVSAPARGGDKEKGQTI